jgi:hypothetical protein
MGATIEDLFGDKQTGGRCMHDAVTAKPAGIDIPFQFRMPPQDGHVVRRNLIRARPAEFFRQTGALQDREASQPCFKNNIEPLPIDRQVVPRRFGIVRFAKQHILVLLAHIEPRAYIDGQRNRTRESAGMAL